MLKSDSIEAARVEAEFKKTFLLVCLNWGGYALTGAGIEPLSEIVMNVDQTVWDTMFVYAVKAFAVLLPLALFIQLVMFSGSIERVLTCGIEPRPKVDDGRL